MVDFVPLPIAQGSEAYNANQFRTHFKAPKLSGPFDKRIVTLADDFQAHFTDYFNGLKAPMELNVGEVHSGDGTRSFLGNPLLRFVINTNIKPIFGDIHSDWVATIKQQTKESGLKLLKGFAVQTLRREFEEPCDDNFKRFVMAGATAAGAAVGGGIGFFFAGVGAAPGAGIGALITGGAAYFTLDYMVDLNKNHFLAGRRSWVMGLVDTTATEEKQALGKKKGKTAVTGKKTTFVADPVFFFETAAVERYSKWAFKQAERDRGALVNMREAIKQVWLHQLGNFVASGSRVSFEPSPVVFKPLGKIWDAGPHGVHYREDHFETESICLNKDWVKLDLLPKHDGLAEQF